MNIEFTEMYLMSLSSIDSSTFLTVTLCLVPNRWMPCMPAQTSLISLTLTTTIKHVLFLNRGSCKPQYLFCVPLFAPLKQLIGNSAFPQLITRAFSTSRLCVGCDLFDCEFTVLHNGTIGVCLRPVFFFLDSSGPHIYKGSGMIKLITSLWSDIFTVLSISITSDTQANLLASSNLTP